MTVKLNQKFNELSKEKMIQIDGGMLPAAVYALGFVMGMTPAGALVVCGATVAAGVATAVAVAKG